MGEVQGNTVIGKRIRPDLAYRVKKYDFKRPDKFSKEQVRTLSIIHESFARLTATSLGARLRTDVRVHVKQVDQCTYEELLSKVPNPAVLPVVQMTPLKGACLFIYPNEMAYSIIERTYGGGTKSYIPHRGMSEIELNEIDDLQTSVLANFREAWSTIFDCAPRLIQIETNRYLCQIVPPTEMIVYCRFECKIGDTEVEFDIAYPFITVEPIVSKLSVLVMYSPQRQGKWTGTPVRIGNIESTIEIGIDGPEISLNELIKLKPGDYLELPEFERCEGYLLFNGTPIDTCTWNTPEAFGDRTFELPRQGAQLPESGTTDSQKQITAEPVKLLAKEIVDELQNEYRRLNRKLDDIVGRQDNLTDQIAFSEQVDDSHVPASAKPSAAPFAYITPEDSEVFVPLLSLEHPQTAALIISCLDTHAAASVLSELPADIRGDVSIRLSTIGRVSPEALRRLDRAIRRCFDQSVQAEFSRPGGLSRMVEILNVVNRNVEKEILDAFTTSRPALAEEVKKRMFSFEDIVLLDTKAVALVVSQSEPAIVALALRGVSDHTRKHLLSNCDDELRKQIEKMIEDNGPARLKDVEQAQLRIVSTIRDLEDRGEIHIARAGEKIV